MSATQFSSLKRLTPIKFGGFSLPKRALLPLFQHAKAENTNETDKAGIYRLIKIKSGTHTKKYMQNPKNRKPGVCGHFLRWPPPHS
jgi:hypothetical protein